jgi:hypothetical protein
VPDQRRERAALILPFTQPPARRRRRSRRRRRACRGARPGVAWWPAARRYRPAPRSGCAPILVVQADPDGPNGPCSTRDGGGSTGWAWAPRLRREPVAA